MAAETRHRTITPKKKESKRPGSPKKGTDGFLPFESLLIEISNQFISISVDRIEDEIQTAQRKVCRALDLDIAMLWQFSRDFFRRFRLTHFYASEDFRQEIPRELDAENAFPWTVEKISKKETVVLPLTSDAPAGADRDRKSWQYFGAKSVVAFPLFVGEGSVIGAMGFSSVRKERAWTRKLVSELQIVSQIFSSALHRRIAETNLRHREEQLSLIADSANAGLWCWHYESNKIWATQKSLELYGLPLDCMPTGDTFYSTLHPDDLDWVADAVRDGFRSGRVVQLEYRIVLPDKRVRWMGVRAQSFLKPSGEPDNMMGVSLDITERRQNEEERIRLQSELAHLSRILSMNELSTSLAHEINQPLGAILNNATAARLLLSRLENTPAEILEILQDIIQDGKRAGDVVRRIRGLVKRSEVRLVPVEINALVETVVELFQNRIKLENVSLRLDLQTDLALVKGDCVQLQQVLLNLITNALDAMKGSTPRTLTICSGMQAPETVVIRVIDSGPGIEPANKDSVFLPFFTTKENGLGIGLTISKSIVEDHGGKIWLEKDRDVGAALSFSLQVWRAIP